MATRCKTVGGKTPCQHAGLAAPVVRSRTVTRAPAATPCDVLMPAVAAPLDGAAAIAVLGPAIPADSVCAGSAPKCRAADRDCLSASVNVLRCRVIGRLVAELFAAACERDLPAAAVRRRPRCHKRQIAMYLSHVVLSVPYRTIAKAFGRDRTTVVYACSVVEDRRDDAGYDRFVEQCERCITAVFAPLEHDNAEF